ncbi:MAG TPA: LuxR C-terminal-related transcriptional regulator [Streptosporangiaceae bacterium]
MAEDAAAERAASRNLRFALAKFRPAMLPATLVARSMLHEQLTAGAGQRLTVVVGSAGAGKSVLLSSWTDTRPQGVTSWLSCDGADANPLRFWTGFIEAPQAVERTFGSDAADLLAMDGTVSADVTASIANDAAKLPPGSAIIVDDLQYAAPAVSGPMTDLVERWPAQNAQLVLASRVDPPLRLHRLRMAGELRELRDRDLHFSLAESAGLLANLGVQVAPADLALLHQRSEGWAAALQMAALSLRSARDPAQAARALGISSHAIAEYFVAEVLDQQPPEVAWFMLDTSILGELTADACAVVAGRPDAATLLRRIDAANLFLIPLDDERTSFRYHQLVRQVLRAELRARDPAREEALQLRAGEWFEATGEIRRATRHFLAARQADRALALLRDRVAADFMNNPALPAPLDVSTIDPNLLASAPDRLLGMAADLLISGEIVQGGKYLDLLDRVQPPIPPGSRLAAQLAVLRSNYCGQFGQLAQAIDQALAARAILERAQLTDDFVAAGLTVALLRVYGWLGDGEALAREAALTLATPALGEPIKQIVVPGTQALAWSEAGHLAQAAEAAQAAELAARRLGFGQHFFAVDHLRALAGLALERRELDAAEQLAEQALSISERRRPAFEFLTLLDRAAIWAARGEVRSALAAVEAARPILAGTGSELLARADELEALLRLSLGDPRTPAELASKLPARRRGSLLARIALAAGDHGAAQVHLQAEAPDGLTPRRALVRQVLQAAVAIERGDPATASIVAGVLQAARLGGFLNTVVTTDPRVTGYLVEHAPQLRSDPFIEQLIAAAVEMRAAQPAASRPGRGLAEPLTAAELRILKLLPTSTYLQMAETLYVSRNTVKVHLRSVYQKLGVTSRSQAIERAVDLRLL